MSETTDLERTERLAAGDACEFRYPARRHWQPGIVVSNGGARYWQVQDARGKTVSGLYIENVRATGTDPWSGF